ncbi:hypothetical protein ABB37_08371 [Leptomonas pyrrhocoris]|uniref:Uncharacterized protein n=1 Tax=Leptomonas pyrrhocoris TaxID=157538 RepID=A0A0N0DSD7_LEPPY|nr:hypothetical protein ABB37_08371 [Leptomonas pyrrhocoris]KPA75454.1 hypothetical protein ABB37_08371 [Leptomonas pyrrhocoris]|eukprot:XP_015653893.1 hypothetical protein ABB37_08371 [Leptomonas pyrrhocoris]
MGSKRSAVVAAITIAALLCISEVRGFAYVPITSVFYAGKSTGTNAGDERMCLSKGGYLATEATAVLHNADIAAMQNAIGTATEFYAYLGGGINLFRSKQGGVPGFCPWAWADPETPSYILNPHTGDLRDCLYRWRAGRWRMMTSDEGEIADEAHSGVSFYKGRNNYQGALSGFPTWWYNANVFVIRPGVIGGRYVVLFQNGETTSANLTPMWTDNFGLGGYTYAGGSVFESDAVLGKLPFFQTICQGQGPFRLNYEDPRASTPQKSDLQYVWWVIFFVILFVLCLIAFLIIACCQEREDMDEPPEDAPEWAEKETEARDVSKRYVSQRSFRVDERGGEDDSSSRHSDSVDKEDTYSDEERT